MKSLKMFRVLVNPYRELVVAVLYWESMSSRITHVNYAAFPLEKVLEIASSDVKIKISNCDALGQY